MSPYELERQNPAGLKPYTPPDSPDRLRIPLRAGLICAISHATAWAHCRISSQLRRSRYSGGVCSSIDLSIGPLGSAGRHPPNTVCPLRPSASARSITRGGSDHDGSGSPVGSPIGPELNTQNGVCASSPECLRRKCLASPRQRFMYTALPSTTASYGPRFLTPSAGWQSTMWPASRIVVAMASAIPAVDPRLEANAMSTRAMPSAWHRPDSRTSGFLCKRDAGLPCSRKAEADSRSAIGVREPDAPTVRLDDRPGDREAEAGAAARPRRIRPRAIERIEDLVALVGRDSVPRIGNLNLDPVTDRFGAHDDATVGGGVSDRVLDQVEQHPLQLLRIC